MRDLRLPQLQRLAGAPLHPRGALQRPPPPRVPRLRLLRDRARCRRRRRPAPLPLPRLRRGAAARVPPGGQDREPRAIRLLRSVSPLPFQISLFFFVPAAKLGYFSRLLFFSFSGPTCLYRKASILTGGLGHNFGGILLTAVNNF